MTDTVTAAQRSAIMSKVKGKNTKPEIALRKKLFSLGFRYRIHSDSLSGKPDIVFPKYKSVIFVHGCFWHSHGCSRSRMPKTNIAYWKSKLERNAKRDSSHIKTLKAAGWRVFIVWECSLSNEMIDRTFYEVVEWLKHGKK